MDWLICIVLVLGLLVFRDIAIAAIEHIWPQGSDDPPEPPEEGLADWLRDRIGRTVYFSGPRPISGDVDLYGELVSVDEDGFVARVRHYKTHRQIYVPFCSLSWLEWPDDDQSGD